MVSIAQLVRASDCGSEGRGFDPHCSPPVFFRVGACFCPDASFFLDLYLMYLTDKDLHLKNILDKAAGRINLPSFADADPVQFPRRFSSQGDIEIASLLCATLAWGKRSMICRDCDRLLTMMYNQPEAFVRSGDFENLPDGNIHRTFFVANLKHWLRGLRLVFGKYGSVENYARHLDIASSPYPAAALAQGLNDAMCEANSGRSDSRCLPLNLETTALKRLNMALRWLVRDDGIVDMGIWKVISPAQLYIPLDVHVGRTARELGLLSRKANDRRSVIELTESLRRFDPDDPIRYDFALFGVGVEGSGLPDAEHGEN